MVACAPGSRRADTLDVFMGGPTAPVGESWREPKSVFSGVNIVQPPGGQSSISFGNYNDQQPPPGTGQSGYRVCGSPLYGRRAGLGQHYPSPQSQLQPRDAPYAENSGMHTGSGGGHQWHPHGQDGYTHGAFEYHTPQVPYSAHAVGQQSTPVDPQNGRHVQAVSREGPRSQSWMGGKTIVQAPGGMSSISLGWETPQHPGPRELSRVSSRNSASPAYAYAYARGGQELGTPTAPRHAPPQAGGEYSQHYMGGKNIVQAPGGTSSLSLGWGHSAEAPPVHGGRSRRGIRAEITSPVGGAGQSHRPPPYPGRSGKEDYSHIPEPYVQAGHRPAEPTFSGVPIMQPPGGRQTINIFG